AVMRTYAQSDIEEFAEFSGVPTINALTDEEHPCQILGDIFTVIEKRGKIEKTVVAYIGDGVSNTARSWLFAAGKLDFELRIASHKKYQPKKKLLEHAGGRVTCTDDVAAAARDADVLYTDIWVSMGSHTTCKKCGNSDISLDRKSGDVKESRLRKVPNQDMKFVPWILSLLITVAVVDAAAPASDKASNSPYEPGNTWVTAQNGGS